MNSISEQGFYGEAEALIYHPITHHPSPHYHPYLSYLFPTAIPVGLDMLTCVMYHVVNLNLGDAEMYDNTGELTTEDLIDLATLEEFGY
mgnify:CR=1 FL=1